MYAIQCHGNIVTKQYVAGQRPGRRVRHISISMILCEPPLNAVGFIAAPQVSGCRRHIRLGQKEAQQTYTQLQAMLQARLDSKAGSGSKAYAPAPQTYPQSPAMPQQYSPVPQMYVVAQQPPAAYQA